MNSPFRYAGGKFYARKLILSRIPFHEVYIEPFAGGGSIFFAKDKAETNLLNDLDKDLINVYRHIRDKPAELINFLKCSNFRGIFSKRFLEYRSDDKILPAKKDLHTFFKKEFEPKNNLEKAGAWYYLNRTSFSGIMNYQNMYWGYGDKYSMNPKNWPRNILRTSRKLQKTKLASKDFEELIDKAPNDAFLFIDPPYYNADQDKFYRCTFTLNDHIRLKNCLNRNKDRLNFFLTYDNTEDIKELYKWLDRIYDKEWNYCIQRTDDQKNNTDKKGKRSKGKELFILNYDESIYRKKDKQLKMKIMA